MPTNGKIKKIKRGFSWIVPGFIEIYGLYSYGMLFLAACLLYMYFGVPYYKAEVSDPSLPTGPRG